MNATYNAETTGWRDDPRISTATQVLKRLPKYAKVAYTMARDDQVPPMAKATLAAGAAYLVSPIDLIPGFIPVLGQLDDLLVMLITLKSAVDACEPEVVQRHFEMAGLEVEALDRDLAIAKEAGREIADRGMQLTSRAFQEGVKQARFVLIRMPDLWRRN